MAYGSRHARAKPSLAGFKRQSPLWVVGQSPAKKNRFASK